MALHDGVDWDTLPPMGRTCRASEASGDPSWCVEHDGKWPGNEDRCMAADGDAATTDVVDSR